MSSFPRTLQRRILRQGTTTTDDDGNIERVDYEPQPQLLVYGEAGYTSTNPAARRAFGRDLTGGYVTCRYTRGFRRFSAMRLRAQAAMQHIELLGQATALRRMSRPVRPSKSERPGWFKPNPARPLQLATLRVHVPPVAPKPKRVRQPKVAATTTAAA